MDGSDTAASGSRLDSTGSRSTHPRRAAPSEHGFGHSVLWTVLGTLLPGVGLLRGGRRVVGGIVLGLWLVLVGGLAYLALGDRNRLAAWATNTSVLNGVVIGLIVLGIAWVVVVGATYLTLRPRRQTAGQRAAGAVLVALLAFAVAAPLALGAQVVATSASALEIFNEDDQGATQPTIDTVDPWAKKPRLNVLVLGGDSGTKRDASLGARTDTVILASIDTATGATTMFSLPRNTAKMPFPKDSPLAKRYPNGFYDGYNPSNPEYFLNAMYNGVPDSVPKDILGKTKNLGADALKLSVGEALGLKVDYYVLINMDGFMEFIDALGGINLNVNVRIPIGGNTDRGIPPIDWIEPGANRHLDGRKALWYARGRWGSDDYHRMDRQRCVINAVVQQAQPATVLTRYQAIAKAGKKIIMTDVPRGVLPSLLDLAMRVKETKLRSVVFKPGVAGFISANPDWDAVRKRVKQSLRETKDSVSPTPSATDTAQPTGTPTSTKSTKPPKTKAPKSDNLDDYCAYHPGKE